jgi:signal transduction histidine kinase/CheY-like chemotaxis protein
MKLGPNEHAEQRLLVLTPTGRDSKLAVELLKRCGFKAEPCESSEELYRELESGVGALLVADEALTRGFVMRMISILENQPPWSDIPMIILTRRQSAGSTAHSFPSLYRRANVTVLERPLKTETLFSVVQNVLAGRQRQYEVRSLLNILEQKIRERDQFLAMLAHELRNPLSAISNALQLMNRSADKKSGRPLEVATRQTKVISRLLDDLLDVSRFANGKITLGKANVGLAAILGNVVDAFRDSIAQKRQHLTSTISRDVIIKGDPIRLAQLFSNLLMNASKYTPADGQIDIRSQIQDSNVAISIKDNGIGIEPELITRLFEPFVQGNQGIERTQGGLGLGLALAKTIVKLHGGSIEAASAGIGSGSEFTVRLPIANAQVVETRSETTLSSDGHTSSLRILLVDDDADAGETLEMLLSEFGYEIHTVKDAPAALTAAFVLQPQVVLLDIGLPGMNGYELAQELRKRMRNPQLLLIALSGYGQPEDLRRSREAGIDYHFLKPLKVEKLQEILTDYEAIGR